MSIHDDNFGCWDADGFDSREEMLAFYRRMQRTNVRKRCKGCGAMVSIQPHYAYCNDCAEVIEHGGEFADHWDEAPNEPESPESAPMDEMAEFNDDAYYGEERDD